MFALERHCEILLLPPTHPTHPPGQIWGTFTAVYTNSLIVCLFLKKEKKKEEKFSLYTSDTWCVGRTQTRKTCACEEWKNISNNKT